MVARNSRAASAGVACASCSTETVWAPEIEARADTKERSRTRQVCIRSVRRSIRHSPVVYQKFRRIVPGTRLTPIVDHPGVGAVEAFNIRPMHRDALRHHPVTMRAHAPEGVLTGQVDTGLDRGAARGREGVDGLQQLFESLARACARPGRGELYIAELFAAFRSRAVQADRESIERGAGVD